LKDYEKFIDILNNQDGQDDEPTIDYRIEYSENGTIYIYLSNEHILFIFNENGNIEYIVNILDEK